LVDSGRLPVCTQRIQQRRALIQFAVKVAQREIFIFWKISVCGSINTVLDCVDAFGGAHGGLPPG
jgi:hypothetical protein